MDSDSIADINPEIVLANYAQFDAGRRPRLGPVESRMFLWSKSGRGRVVINGHGFDVEPFDYFVIPWHHHIAYRPDSDAPFHLAGIHLVPWHDPDAPMIWGVAHDRKDPLFGVVSRADRSIDGLEKLLHFRLVKEHGLIHLSEYIVKHGINEHRDRALLKRCALTLIDEVRRVDTSAPAQPTQIRQMQRFIERNISRPLNVRDLAEAIDRSPSQVTRLCRRHVGMSPGQWISDLKISYACDRLRTTRQSIAEVALSAGFSDQFYFSRLFRKKMGIPPLKYRQQQPPLL